MLPTLKPGDEVLTFNWIYIFCKPKKGELVIIKHNNKEIVKRIQQVSDRAVAVMGDNKKGSTDSRHFGWVDKSAIIGRVIYYGTQKDLTD